MDLNEAVYRGISGRSPHTEGGPVRSVVREIAAVFGATPPEGISASTWRRARNNPDWRPSEATRALLDAYQRRVRLSVGRERWLRMPAGIGLHAVVRVSKDVHERKWLVNTWAGWSTAFPGLMVDRFLARDDDQLGAPIARTIANNVPEMEIVDVIEVRFFQHRSEASRWPRARQRVDG